MNPKLIASLFLAAIAAGVGASLFSKTGKKRVHGRSQDRDRNRQGRKQVSGFLNPDGVGEVELYVGNLSFDMDDAHLRAEFAKYGVVTAAHIVANRETGRSKGFGFVTMPHRKEAAIAVKALDNAEIMGRRLRVNEARGNNKQ